MLLLSWADSADPDLDHYEVRRGTGWMAAPTVYRGRTAQCAVDENLGSETFTVRARNRAGHMSEQAAKIVVATALPSDWTAATGFPVDEYGDGWTGTHSGTEVSAEGHLQLAATFSEGIYQTADLDTGSVAKRRWTAIYDPWMQDLGLLGSMETYPANSTPARERTGEGIEPTALHPGFDFDSVPADFPGPPASYPDWTGRGHRDDVGAFVRVRLEAAFSDDGAAWANWAIMRPQTRTARYVRFRVSLARASPTAYQIQARTFYLHAADGV